MAKQSNPGKGDAVCFTAGPTGALFGLGVIHAYVAADRPKPEFVAGVSAGALSSAAFQRCYRELETARREMAARRIEMMQLGLLSTVEDCRRQDRIDADDLEERRWSWFRRYLSFLVERPLEIFWKVIPDVSDLLADRPPIRETALPTTKIRADQETVAEKWEIRAQRSRHEYYLAVKVMRWISFVRVRVKDVAQAVMAYVRWKEHYPDRFTPSWFSLIHLVWLLSGIVMSLSWTITVHPGFYWRWPYRDAEFEEARAARRAARGLLARWGRGAWIGFEYLLALLPRPFFGVAWLTGVSFLAAGTLLATCAGLAAVSLALNGRVMTEELSLAMNLLFPGLIFLAAAIVPLRLQGGRGLWKSPLKTILGVFLYNARLRDALLNEFYLQLKLDELFRREDGEEDLVSSDPMPALLVATPLEPLWLAADPNSPQGRRPLQDAQVYTQGDGAFPIADALAACLAMPPLLRPVALKGVERNAWMKPGRVEAPAEVNLVDGALVCPNPLPAVFDQLKVWYKTGSAEDQRRVERLFADGPGDYRLHLVYNTPIQARLKTGPAEDALAKEGDLPPLPNCVDSALKGMRLASRRDSRLEVWQTNYQTEFALALRQVSGKPLVGPSGRAVTLPIIVDEIAPVEELEIENPLHPKESPMLRYAAAGCRATLATVFRQELVATGVESMDCPSFLFIHAPGRTRWAGADPGAAELPGVSEICRHCTRRLEVRRLDREMAQGVPHTDRVMRELLPQRFREQPEETVAANLMQGPRIIFVASGGVFRGAFHIGMLGAMWRLGIKPDLIVGASVGTLMGAVLGQLFIPGQQEQEELLHDLVGTFLEVDSRVALTRQLKSAMRDLAVRACTVGLSPNDVRRQVFRGSRKDPGFAATGAPPELIDAISRLFLIPHENTRIIAAQFVSEDVTEAVHGFLRRVRDETVVRLGVREALLGTELKEQALARLLRRIRDRSAPQPFKPHGITFIGTTVNLNTEWIEILGTREPEQSWSYDFAQAALSSSAFPLAFQPRRASQIYPGTGRRDVFFGDGGMYDNLPFLPATLVLGAAQRHRLRNSTPQERWDDLKQRFDKPDLFLVGALDVDPATDDTPATHKESIVSIYDRSRSLAKNMKTRSFMRLTERVDRSLRPLIADPGVRAKDIPAGLAILDNFVHGGVLTAAPSSEEHLNGTYAFCRSLQLDEDKIRRSIADGCFQLMRQIVDNQPQPGDMRLAQRALHAVQNRKDNPVPMLARRPAGTRADGRHCPYYARRGGAAIPCPFHIQPEQGRGRSPRQASIHQTYVICCTDDKHSL